MLVYVFRAQPGMLRILPYLFPPTLAMRINIYEFWVRACAHLWSVREMAECVCVYVFRRRGAMTHGFACRVMHFGYDDVYARDRVRFV